MTRNDQGIILVPAAPFVAALRAEHDKLLEHVPLCTRQRPDNEYPATGLLAARCGVASRRMHGYLRSLNGNKQPSHTDWYRLQRVEQILQPLGIDPWMIYPPDLLDDLGDPEPDRDCPACNTVTPIRGLCPWCDHLLHFDTWSAWILDRARIADELVTDAAAMYQQPGVTMLHLARRYAAQAGMTQGVFVDAIRDEFRARSIRIYGNQWPKPQPARPFALVPA